MASLNHVCIWSEKGWTPIAPQQASRLHPTGGGVSYKSGLFRCDLCGQYVTFVDGVQYVSHFKHSSDEKSKDCPDRVKGSSSINSFLPGIHTLPLKLHVLSNTSFELQMGFISLPHELLHRIKNKKITIIAGATLYRPLIYHGERIMEDCTTYLSLGSQISETYHVEIEGNPQEVYTIWPKTIDGIRRSGTMFDEATGKKLPPDADVQINHKYYLLTTKVWRSRSDIECECVATARIGFFQWSVYRIQATKLSEDAARFFMDYNCRLTEYPVQSFPLWPICVEKPYVILHKQSDITFYLQGYCVTPKVFPDSSIRRFPLEGQDHMAFLLNSRERQQLLSAGRTKVLKYSYLWLTTLSGTSSKPVVTVSDVDGTALKDGDHTVLPKQNIVVLRSQYDGMVNLSERGRLVRRIRLTAGDSCSISVYYGCEITAFQALDPVLRLRFMRAVVQDRKDEELFRRLRGCNGPQIAVSHEWGSLADRLKGYPLTKKWLYQHIKQGYMPESTRRVIVKYIDASR